MLHCQRVNDARHVNLAPRQQRQARCRIGRTYRFQVFGVTQSGQVELTQPDLVARAQATVSLNHY